MMKCIRAAGFAYLCLISSLSVAGETLVAVASNFTAPMTEIVAAFEQESGHRVKISYGSSGKFYAQIINGAPFDAFFSADQAKPQALEKDGRGVPGSRFTYAVGTLALWSPQPDMVDASGQVLGRGEFNRLSLANPKLAPYGAAAIEVLRHLNLEEVTRGKRVLGENIAQAFQFVDSGNAELGFVALSQIMRDGEIQRGSAWRVPPSFYSPIRQDAALLPTGQQNEAARDLLAFMKTPAAQEIMRRYGYQTAEREP